MCKKTFLSFDLCSGNDGVGINQHGKGDWKSYLSLHGKNRYFENLRYRQVEVSVGRGISESEVKRKIWTV